MSFASFINSAPFIRLLGQANRYWYKPSADWSFWILVFLPAFFALIVAWIYWHERGRSKKSRRILPFLLRAFLFAMLVFALLDWDRHGVATRKPDLILIIDDSISASHVDQFDAEWLNTTINRLARLELDPTASRLSLSKLFLLEDNANILRNWSDKYNLRVLLTGESLRPIAGDVEQLQAAIRSLSADQNESRIGDAIAEVCRIQSGVSTAAIVLVSDGIVTSGANIDEATRIAADSSIPLFAVGTGVNRPAIDASLSALKADDTAFVNDLLGFELVLNASGLKGRTLDVGLFNPIDDQPQFRRDIVIDSDSASIPIKFRYRVTTAGEFNFEIRVSISEGETNRKNNVLRKRVVVRDDTIKVLLVQDEPSYEYRFLKQLFDRQKKNVMADAKLIQLTTVLQSAEYEFEKTDSTSRPVFPVDQNQLNEFDVIVFGDVRPQWMGGRGIGELELESLRKFVVEHGGSVVFVAGPNHLPSSYFDSGLASLFPFDTENRTTSSSAIEDVPFRIYPTRIGRELPFFVFAESEIDGSFFSRLPQLRWRWPIGKTKRGVLVLATDSPDANEGAIQKEPLVTLQYVGAGAVVFHATDEFFRWRYRHGDQWYGHYWIQLIRSLSKSDAQGQKVRIKTDRHEYQSNEPILIEARFFDTRLCDGLESIEIQLIDKKTNAKNLVKLSADPSKSNIFRQAISRLPSGDYELRYFDPRLESSSSGANFQVRRTVREQEVLQLNFAGLQKLSNETGGEYVSIQDAATVAERIPAGSTAAVQRLPTQALWTWWPFVLAFAAVFVFAISTEWIIRKKLGMI